MGQRKRLQKFFSVARQLDQNLPAIIGAAQAAQKTPLDQTIDQLDRAMMLQLHAFGQHTDGGLQADRKAAHGQQQLMLLWLDAGLARSSFAES